MLIEQIIEFELKLLGLPDRPCTLIISYFYDKAKISKEYLRVDYFFCQNISEGNNYTVPHFPHPEPSHFQNLAPNCMILNVFWT